MNDKQCLRIIANPHLLKKNNTEKISQSNKIIELENNNLLYKFLENKYKIFVNPTLFYDIIKLIDNQIINNTIQKLIDDLLSQIIYKFDYQIL